MCSVVYKFVELRQRVLARRENLALDYLIFTRLKNHEIREKTRVNLNVGTHTTNMNKLESTHQFQILYENF